MQLDAGTCSCSCIPVGAREGPVLRYIRPYSAVFTVSASLALSRCSEYTPQYRLPAPRLAHSARRLLPLYQRSRDYPRLPEIARDCPRLGSCLLFDFVITSRFVGGVGLVILSIFIYGSKVGQLAVRLSETVRDCPRWPGRLSRDRPERLSRGVTSPPGGAADRVARRCRCPPAA